MRPIRLGKKVEPGDSPGLFGGKRLFALAGILLLLLLPAFSGAFQSPVVQDAESIHAAEYPDLPTAALRGKPLLPLQQIIRNIRNQRVSVPLRHHTAGLPVPQLQTLTAAVSGREVMIAAGWHIQNSLFSSAPVRAGPLCFEDHIVFQNQKQNTRICIYEKVSQRKYGNDHLQCFLPAAGHWRLRCLQSSFLRSVC